MKKRFLMRGLLALSLCSLISCGEDNSAPDIEALDVRTGFDVTTSYSVTQSPFTRGTALSEAGMKQLAYVLLDGDDAVQASGVKTSDLGTLSVDCAPGTYTLLLAANSGVAPTINNDGTITLTKAGDTFSHYVSVEVTRDSRATKSVELTRAAARLVINSTDAVTADVSKVYFKLSGISTIYDVKTHQGTNTTYIENTSNITSIKDATSGKLSMYMTVIIPASITNASLTVRTLDASGAEISTMQFDDLPLTQNKKTNLSAAMFHSHGADASITLSTDWGEEITVER